MSKVLITGAASGLGRALALRFAKENADICIADINMEGAAETLAMVEQAGGKGWTYSLDVTKPEQWQTLLAEVEQRWQGIDVVINNAGVASADRIEQGDWSTWEWVIDINIKGVALGARTFTPLMKKQNRGYFINTASLAGLMTAPFMASYNVTKAAVVALSDTMHHELKPYGIGTTALCPGFFRTNLDKTMRSSDPSAQRFVDKVFEASALDASDIADAAYRAMQKGQLICNPHSVGRTAYFIKRYLPWVYKRLAAKEAIKLKFHDPVSNNNS
ncbi:MAG: SDR family oxidoreductase [Oleispira sp.]|jgi:NAD(P)-dependent dehydrogenase (short-subunit alcohol dehydrogenase family)|nr:SDR family oxidoreductase [Oleispira sp.]